MKTVRIIFSKTDRAKYVSHLDLMRSMTRAMRRSEIPLWYTEGFNRHPYLTFAAPLSLGQEGLRESMDIRLEEDMDYVRLIQRLNEVLPQGITVVSAADAVAKVKELTAAEYTLFLFCAGDTVRALLDQPTIEVEKRTKKKTMKTVDLKPFFAQAVVTDGEGDTCQLEVTLPCGSAENVNPALFVTALTAVKGASVESRILRKRLLKADGTEFL